MSPSALLNYTQNTVEDEGLSTSVLQNITQKTVEDEVLHVSNSLSRRYCIPLGQ